MTPLTPADVLARVAAAIPAKCRANVVIIGSLAAGYHFFRDDGTRSVRTKDVNCVLEPHHLAVAAGQSVTRQLLRAGWKPAASGPHSQPGTADTPTEQLPAVRFYPPGRRGKSGAASGEWFIELFTVPASEDQPAQSWTRLPLGDGRHYGLPSFRFLSLTVYRPERAVALGIRYARPSMMALANLLEHPVIKPETMSALFAGRAIKRSNKDLGRVLALAFLSGERDLAGWGAEWIGAFRRCFPQHWRELAARTGDGLRACAARQPGRPRRSASHLPQRAAGDASSIARKAACRRGDAATRAGGCFGKCMKSLKSTTRCRAVGCFRSFDLTAKKL